MVLYFVKNYIDNNGKAPRNMIESNIRIDYEKLRMLIRKDKEFAHDASAIQTLVSQGYITGELKRKLPDCQHRGFRQFRESALLFRYAYYQRNV